MIFELIHTFQIQKRQLQWPIHGIPNDIMLLVQCCHAYSDRRFQILVDPWDLLVTSSMIMEGQAKFPVVIGGDTAILGHPLRPQEFPTAPNGTDRTSPVHQKGLNVAPSSPT